MKNLILLILIGCSFPSAVFAREITGQVTDENGQTLAGVTVLTDNSKQGCMTDAAGFYKIEVQLRDKFLLFSFIGMETQKVKIKSENRIDVKLKSSEVRMEEVVAVGYGKRQKYELSGNTSPAIRIRGFSTMQHIVAHPDWNTENYATVHESGFRTVAVNPLSTFSVDVDNASYSNVRRFLNQGMRPPKDAVRVEEMLNYFSYNYPEPDGDEPFRVSTELGKCPWNSDHYLLQVGLKARDIDKSVLPPSNLVFLIDVSGSMAAANKLPLLKKALTLLVNELRPEDRVAVVVYAGAAGVVLESTPGNRKETIRKALDDLRAGGSTAGGAGLMLAYRIARENYLPRGNNRIILATDGDFNVGVSSTSEMERLVEEERESGVFMSVLGFGMGNIKDDKMETIADKGNGNYAYIDHIQEARKVLVSEFGGTLFTLAKDVKFQLEFNPEHVQAYRLVGYENRLLNAEDFNDDSKDAGEIGAGHTVTALYELIPAGQPNSESKVDPLKYSKQFSEARRYKDELLTIKLRYKAPDGDQSRLIEQTVAAKPVGSPSANFQFASAVASFGMWLRDSDYIGNMDAEKIIKLARAGRGIDEDGYRAEFIRLVQTAKDLDLVSAR